MKSPSLLRILAVLATGGFLSACTGPALRAGADEGAVVAGKAAPIAAVASPSSAGAAHTETAEDAIRAASVASPYKISERAAKGTIRYRIGMRDGIAWPWPETGEQHVEHDGNTVVLTLCKTCGQEAPPTAAELQRGLLPNPWADSSDRVIRVFASDAHGGNVDRIMRVLVTDVEKRMNSSIFFGPYQTSREAYEAQGGDCTGVALLLAAAAKTRHIPVRLAFGMAYTSRFLGQKRMFGPHMWVQAWSGKRWTSYDAGLGEFDSTHIVLALGDGSPDGVQHVFAKLHDVQIASAEGVLPELANGR